MNEKHVWGGRFLGVIALAAFLAGCAEMGTTPSSGVSPGESTSTTSSGTPPVTGPNRVASGTQGDSLEACLNRIPSDASAGQRMLAERSCHRDARTRQSIEAVPGQ